MEGFQIQPLTRVLAVSGTLGPGEDDDFNGVAIAIGWWPVDTSSPPPEPLYLVSDSRRERPMWVSSAELTATSYGLSVDS